MSGRRFQQTEIVRSVVVVGVVTKKAIKESGRFGKASLLEAHDRVLQALVPWGPQERRRSLGAAPAGQTGHRFLATASTSDPMEEREPLRQTRSCDHVSVAISIL